MILKRLDRSNWDRSGVQKKGLARAIVLEALRRSRSRGIEDAVLYMAGSNEVAWKLYESIGYRAIYRMYDCVKVL